MQHCNIIKTQSVWPGDVILNCRRSLVKLRGTCSVEIRSPKQQLGATDPSILALQIQRYADACFAAIHLVSLTMHHKGVISLFWWGSCNGHSAYPHICMANEVVAGLLILHVCTGHGLKITTIYLSHPFGVSLCRYDVVICPHVFSFQ